MSWLEKLIEMKKYSKMTTEEISSATHIPKSTLDKLFSGKTKDPQLSTVRAVVHSLGYTLDDLSPAATDRPTPLLSNEALCVASAYMAADAGIRFSVRKLLDLSDNDRVPPKFSAG